VLPRSRLVLTLSLLREVRKRPDYAQESRPPSIRQRPTTRTNDPNGLGPCSSMGGGIGAPPPTPPHHLRGADGAEAWLPDGRVIFAPFHADEPLPHWYLIRADGCGLRSLPQLYGAGDPIDWLPRWSTSARAERLCVLQTGNAPAVTSDPAATSSRDASQDFELDPPPWVAVQTPTPDHRPVRVIVVGGGIAGLGDAIGLRRNRA
jgi:hypothetical protein